MRPVLGAIAAHRSDDRPRLAGGGRAFYLPLRHQYLGAPAQLGASAAADALRPLLEGDLPKHTHGRKACSTRSRGSA